MTSKREYWNKRIRNRSSFTATGVSNHSEQVNKRAKEKFAKLVVSALEEWGINLSDKDVLSAGCGTGAVSELLARDCRSVTGFDFSAEAIRTLKSRDTDGEYFQASLSAIPHPDSKFDVVTAFSVLYHIVDEDRWQASIEELASVTADGGHLLLRINWSDEPMGTQSAQSHFYDRSKEEYRKEFEKHSLQILEIEDIPVKPRFINTISALPFSGVLTSAFAPVIVRADLFTDHENKLLVLKKSSS